MPRNWQDDYPLDGTGLNDLATPFIFVPHGEPEPLEWMDAHPGWVKFPAVMVPRPAPDPEPQPAVDFEQMDAYWDSHVLSGFDSQRIPGEGTAAEKPES